MVLVNVSVAIKIAIISKIIEPQYDIAHEIQYSFFDSLFGNFDDTNEVNAG